MSSDISATVRADSGEPSAKRQKTFDCGPNTVWFQAWDDDTFSFETVAVVSRARLSQIRSDMSKVEPWSEPDCLRGVECGILKFDHNASVVKFFAHWTYERNAKAALECCLPEEESWLDFFCKVLLFCHEERIHHDVHDSLMDCLVDRAQCERRSGSSSKDLINDIYHSVVDLEEDLGTITAVSENTKLLDLLAILHIYHLRCDLEHQGRFFKDEQKALFLVDDIKALAQPIMHSVFEERSLAKVPKDPLADDFDEHCRYHLHGDREVCYKHKQS
ncbi:hypothetical protein KCU65_g6220, partial [Aureobasidium melanogenum]